LYFVQLRIAKVKQTTTNRSTAPCLQRQALRRLGRRRRQAGRSDVHPVDGQGERPLPAAPGLRHLRDLQRPRRMADPQLLLAL
ncbi:MAG: hypothetical protein MZV64_63245, partial [Ignavibacteriales bacterium]|nr:hypothetical protein [Ignavibacteriales bacterium]